MRILKIVLTLLFLLPVVLSGQPQDGLCKITDTFDSCARRCLDGGQEKARNDKGAGALRNLKTTNAGTETGGDATTGTVTDLLSPVVLSGLVSDTNGSANGGRITIDLNTLAPSQFLKMGGKLQADVDLEPDLFDPLTMKLKEDLDAQVFGELEETLKGELANTDDITFKLTFNLVNQRAGRDFKAHREEFEALLSQLQSEGDRLNERLAWGRFFQALNRITVGDLAAPEVNPDIERRLLEAKSLSDKDIIDNPDLFEKEDESLGDSVQDLQKDYGKQTFLELAAGNDVAAEQIRAAFEAAVAEGVAFDQQLQAKMNNAGLNLFSALLNNQQQFNLSAKWQVRSDLVGPDQTSVELKWERPLAPSIGAFKKEFHRDYGQSCQVRPADCLTAYQQYVKGHEGDIKSSDRMTFSFEYADVDALTIDRPEDNVFFEQAAAKKLIVKFGYGRSFEVNSEGVAQSRLDLSLSWEDVSDDPMRQDRGIARLTFTRKMGGVDVPFSLVYATKPEFLAMEGVKEELSAHLGITFTLSDLFSKQK